MQCETLFAVAMLIAQRSDPVGVSQAAAAPPAVQTAPAPIPSKPTEPPPERLTTFDPDHAGLDWSFQGWRLTADGATLKDFGRREPEAREALRLIRELRLNQRGTIGGPTPTVEYWLSDGKPPLGPVKGLHVLPLDAAKLRVEQSQGGWVLRDDQRVLFGFGPEEGDARQALAVVRKYGFTHLGTVGPGAPSMMLFFTQTDALAAAVQASDLRPRAAEPPAVDPASPAGKVAVQHPEVLSSGQAAPATPPLWERAFSGNAVTAASNTPDRTPFDWRRVELRQEKGAWKLGVGSLVLADFGSDEHAARLGLSAMQYYRFTERREVGDSSGRFFYFLCAGQPAHGVMFGVDARPFQADRLEVRQVGARWAVCAGDETLVDGGDSAGAAKQILEVIRRQQCDRLCRLGSGDGAGMTFLARSR